MKDRVSNDQQLHSLALEANKIIKNNKYLKKKLDNYNFYNNLAKETMTKSLQNRTMPLTSFFENYAEKLQNDNNKLKKEFKNINLKYNSLKEKCKPDISLENFFEEKKNENFIFEHLIVEKNNIIDFLKKSINSSKEYNYTREPKRDTLIDIKRGKKDLEKIASDLQQSMLNQCKGYNKYDNRIKKYRSQKKRISNNIELLKKYINKKNIQSERCMRDLFKYEKIKYEDINHIIKKKNQSKKSIILEFPKIENLFEISSEEIENENIIDDELHSDEEVNFDKKIQHPKQISRIYINEIKKIVPQFNFDQINFNKSRINFEIDLYSLERRNYKFKNIDNQLKEMNKKFQKINYKLDFLKKKELAMNEYIIKLEEKYKDVKPMIYQRTQCDIQTSSDFITKSLKASLKDVGNYKNFDEFNETVESICSEEKGKENLLFDSITEDENENEINEKNNNNKKEIKNSISCNEEEKENGNKNIKFERLSNGKKNKFSSKTFKDKNLNNFKSKFKYGQPVSILRNEIKNKSYKHSQRARSK